MTPLVGKWVKIIFQSGGDPTGAFWFDISNALHRADIHALSLTVEHARPPFEACYVACSGRRDHSLHTALLGVEGCDPEQGIVVGGYGLVGNNPPEHLGEFVYAVRDGQIVMLRNDMPNEQNVQMVMRFLALWYGSLSQGAESYQPVIKQGLTSQRLQAKGKAPLFSWHTVNLKPPQPKQDYQGSTHASPRLHDRRGHLRRLANGKTCWVRACKVGDASKGVVFKDYEVTA